MASIIPGYEYDIFISYRQKDNKYDGWVTEFVSNLKKEIETTFREEINIYFDINPYDGLLENHDVEDSLKTKLKCLIFIPIISRSYCDPKSFAWKNEFKAFIDSASKDQFGLKVNLPSGNVASRVLPIRIHDLDIDDVKECESILGSMLRGIEFIYREPGADKPLAPEDNEKKNLNNTKYRIQIIKVTHAIKEIILGLKSEPGNPAMRKAKQKELLPEVKDRDRMGKKGKLINLTKSRLLSATLIMMILVIAAITAYKMISSRDKLADLRSSDGKISVAVMPFQNMTNDTIWNLWQTGIQNNMITSLTNSDGLKVRHIESINRLLQNKGFTSYTFMTPAIASSISQKLDASILIYGNITKGGLTIRINAQLIDPKTTESLKSFQIDGAAENILNMVDSLSGMVTDFLLISKMKTEFSPSYNYYASTSSPQAYRYFMYGQEAMGNPYSRITARNWFLQALSIDSNLITATLQIAQIYEWEGNYDEAKKWCLKAYEKRDKMTLQNKLLTNIMYAHLFETPNEKLNYWKQMIEIEDQVPSYWFLIGQNFCEVEQYDKAITTLEKAFEICKKWDIKPERASYGHLLDAYHNSGQHNKEKELYNVAKQDTSNKFLNYFQVIISLDEGDTIAAKRYLVEFLDFVKGRRSRDNDTTKYTPIEDERFQGYLADFYNKAGILDKAEKYYRKILLLHPDEPGNLVFFAKFLINHDLNIEEGLVLINRAKELKPGKYLEFLMLDTEGWGLYKQKKYKEALELLQSYWDVKVKNHYEYDHSAYLHFEAVKRLMKWLEETGQL